MRVSKAEDFDHTIENGADGHDGASTRPRIPLSNGDTAVPIKDETANLGVCEHTLRRMKVPMMNFGGITYVADRCILVDGMKASKRGRR
jgi:hypothetical protein